LQQRDKAELWVFAFRHVRFNSTAEEQEQAIKTAPELAKYIHDLLMKHDQGHQVFKLPNEEQMNAQFNLPGLQTAQGQPIQQTQQPAQQPLTLPTMQPGAAGTQPNAGGGLPAPPSMGAPNMGAAPSMQPPQMNQPQAQAPQMQMPQMQGATQPPAVGMGVGLPQPGGPSMQPPQLGQAPQAQPSGGLSLPKPVNVQGGLGLPQPGGMPKPGGLPTVAEAAPQGQAPSLDPDMVKLLKQLSEQSEQHTKWLDTLHTNSKQQMELCVVLMRLCMAVVRDVYNTDVNGLLRLLGSVQEQEVHALLNALENPQGKA
jgi:hypothetical protein